MGDHARSPNVSTGTSKKLLSIQETGGGLSSARRRLCQNIMVPAGTDTKHELPIRSL